MKYVVDRIDQGIAVCEQEDETMVRFPVSLLPDGTREGSVLREEDGVFTLLEDETDARRQELFDLQNALFGDDEEEETDADNVSEVDQTSGGDAKDDDFFSYFDGDA